LKVLIALACNTYSDGRFTFLSEASEWLYLT
jgi:hypothetical protein